MNANKFIQAVINECPIPLTGKLVPGGKGSHHKIEWQSGDFVIRLGVSSRPMENFIYRQQSREIMRHYNEWKGKK
jgi:hypothetical protein